MKHRALHLLDRLVFVILLTLLVALGLGVRSIHAQPAATAPITQAADAGTFAAIVTPAATTTTQNPDTTPAANPAADTSATAAGTTQADKPARQLPPAAADAITALLTSYPKLALALSIYATLAGLYQVLIAFAHKRAAETSDISDDQWIASLEAKTWFKVLDRIFYFGGYLGAWSGGKKL